MLIFFWSQSGSTPPESPSIIKRIAYGWGVTMKHIVHPYHVFTTRY